MAVRSAERHRPDAVPVGEVPTPEPAPGELHAVARHESRDVAPRKRRARLAAVGLASLLVAAAVTASASGDGDGTVVTSAGRGAATPAEQTASTVASTVATTTPPEVATTTPAATTRREAPAPTATTATTAAPPPASATTAAPATTAASATACRNSTDPACGPFRFDLPPAADRPMTLTVSTGPAALTAGTEVVFRVVLEDPDGVDFNGSIVDYGDGVGIGGSQVRRCEKYGPWDPPAPGQSETVRVVEYRHVFAAPGTYTARFSFDAGPFDCTDPVTGAGDRPYASSASGDLVVAVAP